MTDGGLFFLVLYADLGGRPITAAILRGDGVACRFELESNIRSLDERIVVSSDRASAFALGTPPLHDKHFQRRITELSGRPLKELIDFREIRTIVKPKAFVSKAGIKAVDLSDQIIVSALQTGRIVNQSDMHFHLQTAREFVLRMPDETVTIGVYYRPVGYIRFVSGESYWFLFGTKEDSVEKPKTD